MKSIEQKRADLLEIARRARDRGDADFLRLMTDVLAAVTALPRRGDVEALKSAVLSEVAARHPQLLERMERGLASLWAGYLAGAA